MLTVKNVADELALSISAVYALVERGELGHYRIGGAIRIGDEHLSEFLASKEKRGREPQPLKANGSRPDSNI
jgi:excisionase family DNA binding protein